MRGLGDRIAAKKGLAHQQRDGDRQCVAKSRRLWALAIRRQAKRS
jgi:hypothetical protein